MLSVNLKEWAASQGIAYVTARRQYAAGALPVPTYRLRAAWSWTGTSTPHATSPRSRSRQPPGVARGQDVEPTVRPHPPGWWLRSVNPAPAPGGKPGTAAPQGAAA